MKILLLSAVDPSDFRSGAGLVIGHSVQALAKAGVKLTMLVFSRKDLSLNVSRIKELAKPGGMELRLFPRNGSSRDGVYRCVFGNILLKDEILFLDNVSKTSSGFDAAVWFGPYWDPLSAVLPSRLKCPVVHFVADSITRLEEHRPFSFSRIFRVAAARKQERKVLASGYASTIYVAGPDAAAAKALASPEMRRKITFIENGVDTKLFRAKEYRPGNTVPVLLFTGVMEYLPNVEAALNLVKQVLPRLKRDVRVRIAGRDPAPAVKELERYSKNVTVTGPVNDISAEYRGADVFVIPMLSGTGFKNKMLEALSSGLPVVSTRNPAGGFGTLPPGVIVADTFAAMAAEIDSLLERPAEISKLGAAAAGYVRRNCTWEVRLEQLVKIIHDCSGNEQ